MFLISSKKLGWFPASSGFFVLPGSFPPWFPMFFFSDDKNRGFWTPTKALVAPSSNASCRAKVWRKNNGSENVKQGPWKLMIGRLVSYNFQNYVTLPTSRWWQLKDFLFSPRTLGKMNPIFDEHIFQVGWFNHQPANSSPVFSRPFFESMIFRTSRLVGYEKIPWRVYTLEKYPPRHTHKCQDVNHAGWHEPFLGSGILN